MRQNATHVRPVAPRGCDGYAMQFQVALNISVTFASASDYLGSVHSDCPRGPEPGNVVALLHSFFSSLPQEWLEGTHAIIKHLRPVTSVAMLRITFRIMGPLLPRLAFTRQLFMKVNNFYLFVIYTYMYIYIAIHMIDILEFSVITST
ncbi:hypothetical protein GIB67_020983 [Kingdonia uniflora]|uniref:Uncharacterized protein n=1 Tax=Kingdonia uniflora TaxID=39325 RepID=A0A7J7M7Y8_9MAGN|nr:hypothetical protein GIB67_020983 [Kingdonia uniflora]